MAIEPKQHPCVVCGRLGKPSTAAIPHLTEGTVMINTLMYGPRAICGGCVTEGTQLWAKKADMMTEAKKGPKSPA